jgi:hypothetical protein
MSRCSNKAVPERSYRRLALFSFLTLVAFFSADWRSHALEAKASGPRDHLILAFDASCSMAGSQNRFRKRDDQRNLDRLKGYLLQALYERLPKQVHSPDRILPETLTDGGLNFDAPLYKRGDSLTYFAFADEPRYVFAGKEDYVTKDYFSRQMPNRFSNDCGSLKCAMAEAFQNARPTTEGKTYLILVSDKAEGGTPSANKQKAQDCEARLAAYEADAKPQMKYGLEVGKRYYMKIYQLEATAAPYPFYLVRGQSDTPVDGLQFKQAEGDKSSADKDYRLIANPKLKQNYQVSNITAVIRPKDKDKISSEVKLVNKRVEPPVSLDQIKVDRSYVSDNYNMDLEIEYQTPDAGGRGRRSNPDYFVIRSLALTKGEGGAPVGATPGPSKSEVGRSISAMPGPGKTEESRPLAAPVNPFELSEATVSLKPDAGAYKASPSIRLKNRAMADRIDIKSVTWSDDKGRFNLDLTPKGPLSFPAGLNVAIPSDKLEPGATFTGTLYVSYQSKGSAEHATVQSLPLSLKAEAPKVSQAPEFALEGAEPGKPGALELAAQDGKLSLKETRISAKGPLPDGFKVQGANLRVGSASFPLPPETGLDAPINAVFDKDQWKDIWNNQKEPSSIELTYTSDASAGTTKATIPVALLLPEPKGDEIPKNAFMIVSDPGGANPADVIQAKWADNGLKINDFFLKPKPELKPEVAASLKDMKFKTSGLATREGRITQFPLKLELLLKPEEVTSVAAGQHNLGLELDYVHNGVKGKQEYKLVVNVPKTQDPQFIIAVRGTESTPAREIQAQNTEGKIVVSNLVLKTVKPNGLQDVEKIQMLSGNSVLYEWQKKSIPKLGFLPDAIIPENKVDTGSPELPVHFKVIYTQMGREGQGTAQLAAAKLLVPRGWPWPLSELEGLLPAGLPLPAVIAIVLLIPLLIILAIIFLLRMLAMRRPIHFSLVAVGVGDDPYDPDLSSPVYSLKRGERLGLGPDYPGAACWDALKCSDNFVECRSVSFFGKKALYLGDVAQLSSVKMDPGREYTLQCAEGKAVPIRALIISKPPKVKAVKQPKQKPPKKETAPPPPAPKAPPKEEEEDDGIELV